MTVLAATGSFVLAGGDKQILIGSTAVISGSPNGWPGTDEQQNMLSIIVSLIVTGFGGCMFSKCPAKQKKVLPMLAMQLKNSQK